jgi:Asp/Glu/hydantoin racemase
MLACFGEPGLWALREAIPLPVTGMVEASVAAASQLGRRIAILTSGRDWPPQIADLLKLYGQSARVTRITALPDAALSEDRNVWHPALTDAVAQDVALGRADVLILGGGPLSGRAETLTPPSGIKMIDAFDATLWQSLALASMNKLSGTNP